MRERTDDLPAVTKNLWYRKLKIAVSTVPSRLLRASRSALCLAAVVLVASAASVWISPGPLWHWTGWQRMHLFAPLVAAAAILGLRRYLRPQGSLVLFAFHFSVVLFLVCAAPMYYLMPPSWKIEEVVSFSIVAAATPLIVAMFSKGDR